MKTLTMDLKGNGLLWEPGDYDASYCGPNKLNPLELNIAEIAWLYWKIKKVKITFNNLEITDSYGNTSYDFVPGAPQFYTTTGTGITLDTEDKKIIQQLQAGSSTPITLTLPFTHRFTGYPDMFDGTCFLSLDPSMGRRSNTSNKKQFVQFNLLLTAGSNLGSYDPGAVNTIDIDFFGFTLPVYSYQSLSGTFSILHDSLFAYT